MPEYFLVTGSRDFPEELSYVIHETLDSYLKWHPDVVMINGMAPGVDSICFQWARDHDVYVEGFPADWDRHGIAAGPIRNAQMINRLVEQKSTTVFAFFYGDPVRSRGTSNTVAQCRNKGIEPTIRVVPLDA